MDKSSRNLAVREAVHVEKSRIMTKVRQYRFLPLLVHILLGGEFENISNMTFLLFFSFFGSFRSFKRERNFRRNELVARSEQLQIIARVVMKSHARSMQRVRRIFILAFDARCAVHER